MENETSYIATREEISRYKKVINESTKFDQNKIKEIIKDHQIKLLDLETSAMRWINVHVCMCLKGIYKKESFW